MDTFMNGVKDEFLQTFVSAFFVTSNAVHLFANNVIPSPGDTLGTYTEATYSGYTPALVQPWSAAAGGSGGTSQSTAQPAIFAPGTLGTPQDVYGWYLTDDSGNLVAAGVFGGGPLNMGGTTTSLTVILTLTQS